jgi:hypothetical protein
MRLRSLLARKKAVIIKKWFGQVIETYPADTAKFLKSQKDPFANPVGRTIYRSLEALFDQLLEGMDPKALTSCLDPIIRIRAVQNFSPSQAVGFVFLLKGVIRTNVRFERTEQQMEDELLLLESRIDQLGLLAFNIYMQCREKIYELKANEMKNRTFKAFERAGLVKELPEVEPVLEPINNFRQEAPNEA